MFSRKLIWLLPFLVMLAGPAAAQAVQSCERPVNRPFRVFHSFNYARQPDLSRYGIESAHVIDRGIWREGVGRDGPPDPELVRATIAALPDNGAPVILDFESADAHGDDRAAARVQAQLDRIISTFRRVAPHRQYGFYTMLPLGNYWQAIEGPQSPGYREWRRKVDRLRSLERRVDFLFPSIYTYYEDRQGWVAYATAQICEARRLSNKPVYVFLWPEFHDGPEPHRGVRIPGSYWRLQLETARRLADGVVLWGGYDLTNNRAREWEPQQEWWIETVRFMRRLER